MPDTHSPALAKPLRPLSVACAEHEEDVIERAVAEFGSLLAGLQSRASGFEPDARSAVQDFADELPDLLDRTLGWFLKKRSDARDDAEPIARPAQWVKTL